MKSTEAQFRGTFGVRLICRTLVLGALIPVCLGVGYSRDWVEEPCRNTPPTARGTAAVPVQNQPRLNQQSWEEARIAQEQRTQANNPFRTGGTGSSAGGTGAASGGGVNGQTRAGTTPEDARLVEEQRTQANNPFRTGGAGGAGGSGAGAGRGTLGGAGGKELDQNAERGRRLMEERRRQLEQQRNPLDENARRLQGDGGKTIRGAPQEEIQKQMQEAADKGDPNAKKYLEQQELEKRRTIRGDGDEIQRKGLDEAAKKGDPEAKKILEGKEKQDKLKKAYEANKEEELKKGEASKKQEDAKKDGEARTSAKDMTTAKCKPKYVDLNGQWQQVHQQHERRAGPLRKKADRSACTAQCQADKNKCDDTCDAEEGSCKAACPNDKNKYQCQTNDCYSKKSACKNKCRPGYDACWKDCDNTAQAKKELEQADADFSTAKASVQKQINELANSCEAPPCNWGECQQK